MILVLADVVVTDPNNRRTCQCNKSITGVWWIIKDALIASRGLIGGRRGGQMGMAA
jgi:hypothetical protein